MQADPQNFEMMAHNVNTQTFHYLTGHPVEAVAQVGYFDSCLSAGLRVGNIVQAFCSVGTPQRGWAYFEVAVIKDAMNVRATNKVTMELIPLIDSIPSPKGKKAAPKTKKAA